MHANGEWFARFAINCSNFELPGDRWGGEHDEREGGKDGGNRQECHAGLGEGDGDSPTAPPGRIKCSD